MQRIISKTDRPFIAARVIAHASPPAYPTEVFELAVLDVVIDCTGVWIGSTQSKAFDPNDDDSRSSVGPCTPLHLAAAIWGGWTPDVLVSHDAASEALLFDASVTRGLPWLSLHKIARQLWPKRGDYRLESLRERRGACPSGVTPSGAAREAELTAHLLSAMYGDPKLRTLVHTLPATLTFAQPEAITRISALCEDEILRAMIQVSSLPATPLRSSPAPWDDGAEWSSVGLEDLHFWAADMRDPWAAEAAQSEIERRRRAAVARWSVSRRVVIRRREPLKRSRIALADVQR